MTGTPDVKPLAPAPHMGAAAAQPVTAPAAMPQHRQCLVVTLPGGIEVTDDGQVHDTLVLSGDIDEETYPVLIEALSRIPRDNAGLHVDLSAVTFCDLAGLRAIVRLAESTTAVTLYGVPRTVLTVMKILGWDQQPGLVVSKRRQHRMPVPEGRPGQFGRREGGPAGICADRSPRHGIFTR
jgi:ABC-type transporter Mla MlaB component